MDIDSFAPRLSFFFNTHNDFLEEIAKFRAARRIWARIAKERFGAKNPRSMMLAFSRADGGFHADCATAGQQHRARGDSGTGGRSWRGPVAAYQLQG